MSGIYSIEHQIEYTSPGNYTWIKPPGIIMVYILCIGGGGGGGSTPSQTAGTNRAGGGGGGSGSFARGIFPAFMLPDVLFVTVGTPGIGQVGGVGSTNGGTTAVMVYNNPASPLAANVTLIRANGGSTAAQTAAGAGASNSVGTTQPMGQFGINSNGLSASAGAAGVSGNTGGALTLFSVLNTVGNGGTAGGGINSSNTEFAGGAYTCTNPDIATLKGGVSPTYSGNNGIAYRQAKSEHPFYNIGGTGGGGNASGAGGRGGNGILGGGGGGSGANSASSASVGGDGGSGYVLIQCI